MTARKPPGVSFESWVDRQIREAAERGAFDNLPGAGKPIDLSTSQDENWWIRGYLEKEGVSADALLPRSLRLAKDAEQLPRTVAELGSEDEVRAVVRRLNARIASYVLAPSAPLVRVRPLDADDIVIGWRAARAATELPTPQAAATTARPRWWRRR